jgi:hypothetical protein
MSYKATGWAYDLPVTGSKKSVLVALADMADEANTCYPGQERLAAMTGRSVETVRRALKDLEAMQLIERERRVGSFGYRTSDRYKLNVDNSEPESLPVKLPTRQRAHKAPRGSLPVILPVPTGQVEGAMNHQLTTSVNHQGEPALFCDSHPGGTNEKCGACGDARRLHHAWERNRPAVATVPGIVTDPDCPKHPHRPLVGCDRCGEEAES